MLMDSILKEPTSIALLKQNKRMREATNLVDNQLEEVEEYHDNNNIDMEDDCVVFDNAEWAVQSENDVIIQQNEIEEEVLKDKLEADEIDKIDEIKQAEITFGKRYEQNS
jgi:hypothetical protein